MEKSNTLIITYAISFYFIIFSHTDSLGQFFTNESFGSMDEIIAKGKENYNFVGDTAYFKLNNKEYFVLCGDNHSGMMMQTVYMFEGIKSEGEMFWTLVCMRASRAKAVVVENSPANQEIVFMSESKEVIMSIPYKSLGF